MPIFGKVPREYLFESTRIDSSRCRPDFTRYIPDGSPARKKCGRWYPHLNTGVITATYQPDTSTHFKLPFWIKWSTWFNKIWKWKNHLSFKRMILEAQATRTISIFIRLNDKMMNIGFHLNLVIHFRRLQWTKLHFSYIPYISAGWDTLLYIEIRSLYIILHLFLDVPINPTKFYHKMN